MATKTKTKNKFHCKPGYYEWLLCHENYDEPIATLGDVNDDFVDDASLLTENQIEDGYPVVVKTPDDLRGLIETYMWSFQIQFEQQGLPFGNMVDGVKEDFKSDIEKAIYDALNFEYFEF